MSGFAGFMNTATPGALVRRMGRVIDARGPVARHEVEAPGCAFVVTQSGGGGRPVATLEGWTVAIDGQVLNAASLAREMGFDPADGPAATVARLLRQVGGAQTLSRLAGPAAVAAWNPDERVGFVSRDRIGERPVFVASEGDGLAFASEARALSQAGLAGSLDPAALRRFVAASAVVPPGSWARGARALAPGAWEELGVQRRQSRGWNLPVPTPGAGGNRERWLKSVRFALDHAFSARARVAGPYAIGVSGGLGSAALLACLPAHDRPSLALVLDDEGEASAARAGIRAQRVRVDANAVFDEVALDAPVGTPVGLAYLALARAAWAEGLSGLALGTGHGYAFDPPRPLLGDRLGQLIQPRSGLRRFLDEVGPLPGDAEAGVFAEVEALAAAVPVDDVAAGAHWLGGRVTLPEVHLRDAVAACAAYGLVPLLPMVDQGVIQVATQVPCGVHHHRARRSLLAELGGVVSRDPAWPAVPMELPPDLDRQLGGLVSAAHVRAVVRDPAWASRAFRLASLAQWLGAGAGGLVVERGPAAAPAWG